MPSFVSTQIATLGPFFHDVLGGAAITIVASIVAFAIGIVLGSILLLARLHGGRVLASLVLAYVSVIRGTPALIQMLVAYYVLPSVLNLPLSPLQAGILALAMNTAAYVSEILRGSFNSLGRGQLPAALALGMRADAGLAPHHFSAVVLSLDSAVDQRIHDAAEGVVAHVDHRGP